MRHGTGANGNTYHGDTEAQRKARRNEENEPLDTTELG
jgi:hypothetical protein